MLLNGWDRDWYMPPADAWLLPTSAEETFRTKRLIFLAATFRFRASTSSCLGPLYFLWAGGLRSRGGPSVFAEARLWKRWIFLAAFFRVSAAISSGLGPSYLRQSSFWL